MQIGIFTVGDVTTDPTTGRTPTEHERIMRSHEDFTTWTLLEPALENLQAALAKSDAALARKLIMDLVPEFAPTTPVIDWVVEKGAASNGRRSGRTKRWKWSSSRPWRLTRLAPISMTSISVTGQPPSSVVASRSIISQ